MKTDKKLLRKIMQDPNSKAAQKIQKVMEQERQKENSKQKAKNIHSHFLQKQGIRKITINVHPTRDIKAHFKNLIPDIILFLLVFL